MTPKEVTSTSKFLSLVLRHEPGRIGLTLDDAGWVETADLLSAMARHGRILSSNDLRHVVETNDKKRFEFSPDEIRIRASQGHSIEVDLGYEPLTPPPILFHGTAERNLAAIRSEGLRKMSRSHVHLSSDPDTARQVGQRYGRPVVLIVLTEAMVKEGALFFRSTNGVWLTEQVPPAFIRFPD